MKNRNPKQTMLRLSLASLVLLSSTIAGRKQRLSQIVSQTNSSAARSRMTRVM